MIPHIPMNFEGIGSELRSWVDGEHTEYTEGINNWMKINGLDDKKENKSGNGGDKGYNDSKKHNKYSNEWLRAEFPTEKSFNRHYDKHLNEYENITKEEYLSIARNLLASPIKGDIEGFKSEIGFVFRYNKHTNDFAIGRADGGISTLYKPKKGYKQWLEEIDKYKKEG